MRVLWSHTGGKKSKHAWPTTRHRLTLILGMMLGILAMSCSTTETRQQSSPTTRARPATTTEPDPPGLVGGCGGEQRHRELAELNVTPEWAIDMTVVDSSSVSHTDINGDGVSDAIVNGNVPSSSGSNGKVYALEGRSGQVIWESSEEINGITVPLIRDLDHDGIPDVVFGGRGLPDSNRPLVALDGKDGSTIWRVLEQTPDWQNVYTPQDLGDVDGDGVEDILVATGGDHVRDNQLQPTVPGRVMVVSGRSGAILGQKPVPDRQEIYSSPVLLPDGSRDALIGTGGEVFSGGLWRIPLGSLLREAPTSDDSLMIRGNGSSFIAPPVINNDVDTNETHLLALRLDGRLFSMTVGPRAATRTNWSSDVIDWIQKLGYPGRTVAALTVPALGQFDDDEALEVVVQVALIAPAQLAAGYYGDSCNVVVVLDGRTGDVQWVLDGGPAASSISPLVLSRPDGMAVLCACVASRTDGRDAEYALWYPALDRVELLAIGAQGASTPSLVNTPDGDVDLLVAMSSLTPSQSPGQGRSKVARIRLGKGAAIWSGYMNLRSDQ